MKHNIFAARNLKAICIFLLVLKKKMLINTATSCFWRRDLKLHLTSVEIIFHTNIIFLLEKST